jgi:dTDP-4-amino-4,6-dideoxy-D-galactose acyltransferase
LQLNRPVACIRETEEEGELIDQLAPEGGIFDLGILAAERVKEVYEHVAQIIREPESLDYHRALAASTISPNNLEDVCDIINVVKILPWDTDFFGFTVAFLSSLKLNPAIARFVLEFCAKHKVRLVEYQCDCHDRESVLLAERHGFNFADIRLTFERFINGGVEPLGLPTGFDFDIAQEADIPALMEIADGLYVDSRYYFDTHFPRDRVHQFYKDWVRKAVLGTFDDCAMILRHQGRPIGFFTVKYEPNGSARFRLVGIDSRYRSRGLALAHLRLCLRELAANGVKYVQVTTQGRNYAAQRLYQKAGFVTQKTELWYHKWFQSEELSYY